jgi:hypothetical protein
MYNLSTLSNITGLGGLVSYANTTTEGHLIGMFIVAIFFISIIKLKQYSFDAVFFAASWICFVFSAFLIWAGWLNMIYAIGFLVAAAFSALYLYTVKK